MPAQPNFVPVPGSERAPMPGARGAATIAPNERLEVTLRVRHRPSNTRGAVRSAAETPQIEQREYLSHAEYTKTFGADPKDIA